MAIASPRGNSRHLQPVPSDWEDETEHRRLLGSAVRQLQERVRIHPVEVVAVTANYTMVDIDLAIEVDATGGNRTITLLTAASREGRRVVVKKIDSSTNTVTIDAAGSETMDGATTIVLASQYDGRELVSNGVNWDVTAVTSSAVALAAAGTYTPTLTNIANLDGSTAFQAQYLRVGATVMVSGKVDVNPTAEGAVTRLGISLPVASNIGAEEDCAGTAISNNAVGTHGAILGDATNNRAELYFISSDDIASQSLFFSFSYQVL